MQINTSHIDVKHTHSYKNLSSFSLILPYFINEFLNSRPNATFLYICISAKNSLVSHHSLNGVFNFFHPKRHFQKDELSV